MTLIEVLSAIGIVAVLTTLLFSSLSRAKMSAARIKCTVNLARIASGFQLYANDNGGRIPPGWYTARQYVWQYDVAPYLDQVRSNSHGAPGTIWQCPAVPASDIAPEISTYAVNKYLLRGSAGPDKTFLMVQSPARTVLLGDGAAINTDILQAIVYGGGQGTVVFRHPSKVPGNPPTIQAGRLKYRGEGVANLAFCDGHVEGLKPAAAAEGGDNSIIWQP